MLRLTTGPATSRPRHIGSILHVGALVALTGLWIANSASAEPKTGPGSVRVTRDVKDPRWLHGSVDVAAPADEVLLRLQKVDQWQALLSDIKQLKVKSTSKGYWLAEIESKTMNCGSHDYHVRLKPNRTLSFVIDATALAATGYIQVQPLAKEPAISTIKFDLFVETTGVIGWFIPESAVRSRQEAMVRRDLTDLGRTFTQ